MHTAQIIIRRNASEDSLTVKEPRGTTRFDLSKLDRSDRNRLRHRVVALFEADRKHAPQS